MKRFSFASGWLFAGVRGLACALAGVVPCASMAQSRPVPVHVSPASAPGDLGTLILSPAERRRLEVLRNTAANPESEASAQAPDRRIAAVSALPDTLVVSGVVVRSGNRSTVWVNSQPVYGQDAVTPLRTLAGRAGVLQQGAKDMRINALAGQVIDVPSGQTVDLLPSGAIRIIPPKVGAASNTQKE